MKKAQMYLLIIASLAIMFSCGSDNDDLQTGEITLNKTALNLVSGAVAEEVILSAMGVSGDLENVEWTSSNPSVAKVDSDGKITALSKGTAVITAKSGKNIASCEVKVAGVNTYYIGQKTSTEQSVLYKNDEIVAQETGSFADYAISGNDIYIVGSENDYPVMWKNGVKTVLSANKGNASSIVLSGSDVYIGGVSYNVPSVQSIDGLAVIWKNGVETLLPYEMIPDLPQPYPYPSAVNKLVVSDGDLYIGGHMGWRPMIWKNEAEFYKYPEAASSHGVENFCFSGNDFYYVWHPGGGRITLMKNGEVQPLVGLEEGQHFSSAVFVKDNDVYVVGSTEREVVLFKNGQKVALEGAISNTVYIPFAHSHSLIFENDLYIFGKLYEYGPEGGKRKDIVWKNQEVIYTSYTDYTNTDSYTFTAYSLVRE